MNMKVTPPGDSPAWGAKINEFGKLASDYSNNSRFFDSDMSLENDRLRLNNEQLTEEIKKLEAVIAGLLSENDQGESS
ncbi:MAG: hypothetical protein AB2651_22115 [Candidatus Thiodiazotropha sp.]